MVITTPAPPAGPVANAVRDLGIADHLRLSLSELITLLHEAERNTSVSMRTAQAGWALAEWSDLLLLTCRAQPFAPLTIAIDAANALMRVAAWSAATREVLVWSFRAWTVSRVRSPMPARLGAQLTAWANPDLPPALRRAVSATALGEVRP